MEKQKTTREKEQKNDQEVAQPTPIEDTTN